MRIRCVQLALAPINGIREDAGFGSTWDEVVPYKLFGRDWRAKCNCHGDQKLVGCRQTMPAQDMSCAVQHSVLGDYPALAHATSTQSATISLHV